ncbi:phosphodiester glycosidase family protein [Paenibacillus sp. 1001270B_150601_E10]|uniref:phosphodiester glycosidase family protein n=1 Tax=Paenibacillus sp. 1001270B_150601_E10 TaxID=2787079 RepID=UPI00189EE060|nr:phosphodiester glycosidase family protein [Paenibacillus sp. 1001270B_150601_E10]
MLLPVISCFIIFMLLLAYGLADRYLIEHAEQVVHTDKEPGTSIGRAMDAQADDWNYTSDEVEIHIKEMQQGDGTDLVTYFVADVKMKDASHLKTAFAKDTFGRNIVEPTSQIAQKHNALLAINGDYYGFRSDGLTIRNGTLYRDEPARDGLAFYADGLMKSFDELSISSKELLQSGVTHTFSFGPVLVTNGEIAGDFEHVKVDTNFGNHSIQAANPRTGVGYLAPNHYVFVIVDGRKENYSRGMTLTEFAQVFQDLGCTEAYNLDGGGSSTLYFRGRVVNNPLGREKERSVSDILYVTE